LNVNDSEKRYMLKEFLDFLTQDIEKNPQQIQAISPDLAIHIQCLVSEVEIDLDVPLPDEEVIQEPVSLVPYTEEMSAEISDLLSDVIIDE